jgi:hypothetical protein
MGSIDRRTPLMSAAGALVTAGPTSLRDPRDTPICWRPGPPFDPALAREPRRASRPKGG